MWTYPQLESFTDPSSLISEQESVRTPDKIYKPQMNFTTTKTQREEIKSIHKDWVECVPMLPQLLSMEEAVYLWQR